MVREGVRRREKRIDGEGRREEKRGEERRREKRIDGEGSREEKSEGERKDESLVNLVTELAVEKEREEEKCLEEERKVHNDHEDI